MPNLKDLQKQAREEMSKKIKNVFMTVFQLSGYDENQIKEKIDIICDEQDHTITLVREVIYIVEKVEEVNEINGRYNACQEILSKLSEMGIEIKDK